MKRVALIIVVELTILAGATRAGDGRQVRVGLELYSGGQVTGEVTEYDDRRLVLKVRQQLVGIGWDEVQTPSAYRAKKKLLESARGSLENLTAEDHFQLGYFLAMRNSHSAAVSEFRQAGRRDPTYKERVKEAWREIRRAKERSAAAPRNLADATRGANHTPAMGRTRQGMNYKRFTPEQHRQAIAQFKHFGAQVGRTIAPDLVLLETRNFLIWTDWPQNKRNLVADWAEQMYQLMCQEFGFPEDQPIWLGKCPIFCFRSEKTFTEFAEQVDGYHNRSALGYTKTTEQGYVHVVLRRLGTKPDATKKFATTMVHETSHAFMHSYGSPRNLPPWLSEGLADYIAERVLGERCDTGETAAAVARQYAHQKKSIKTLFEFEESPPGSYYPIAYSVVEYLITRDREAFVRLINDIKSGRNARQALALHYNGMDTNSLEYAWRSWVLKRYPSNS